MNALYRIIVTTLVLFLVIVGGIVGFSFGSSDSETIQSLTERVQELERYVGVVAQESSDTADELKRREALRQKSQEELLTDAVAKIAPSVVSVVVSKDVPKIEIVYENPFGDDPFFRNFNIQVPRIVQKGTEVQQVGAGTGFFLRSDGYIATNRHVVSDADALYTVVLSDGSQKQADVIYRDTDIDFAILKVSGEGYPGVVLGNSDSLKLGQSVFAIGNALGEFNNSVSVGIISGLNRELSALGADGPEELRGVIQTDAAINPGNSGGPLSDLSGAVIGINVAMARGSENVGFSIPINVVKDIISSVL
ncbi:trypsin-like peptidase domain-containing protein [Candidatus Kaiserbacteria bacterium]|nr:trypsin-like peptidase domain-containing protein [Candidatus Kaiserbacteria bacterium]